MDQDKSKVDEHARLCAVRNVVSSLSFVGACLLMVYLSWTELGKPFHKLSNYYLFWMVISIWVDYELLLLFRCIRERLILCLGLLVSLRALLSRFAPIALNQFAIPVRQTFLLLWIIGLLTSFSMFFSAAFKPKVI